MMIVPLMSFDFPNTFPSRPPLTSSQSCKSHYDELLLTLLLGYLEKLKENIRGSIPAHYRSLVQ